MLFMKRSDGRINKNAVDHSSLKEANGVFLWADARRTVAICLLLPNQHGK